MLLSNSCGRVVIARAILLRSPPRVVIIAMSPIGERHLSM
jgi:hypothetical protein